MKSMNWKRWAMAVFAVFATILLTDWFIHGFMLQQTYRDTATLWRPEAEMATFMSWMMTGQLLTGAFLCWIFAKGYEGKGWMEGVRYGALIGAFAVSHFFMTYAVSPYPFNLFMSWVVTGWVQAVICGVVAAMVYGWKGGPKRASAR